MSSVETSKAPTKTDEYTQETKSDEPTPSKKLIHNPVKTEPTFGSCLDVGRPMGFSLFVPMASLSLTPIHLLCGVQFVQR